VDGCDAKQQRPIGGIVVGNSMAQTSATKGKVDGVKSASIFLVEDEALIRPMLADMMGELGHVVVGEASNIEIAQRLAETADFNLAILDINVAGCNIWPIAETIERRGLPFLFMSGYASDSLPEAFHDRPVLNKPCTIQKLKQAIDRLLP
jgi:CheY-like chemotaxis protein